MPPVGVGSLLCEDAPARPLSACLQGEALRKRIKKQAVSPDTACRARWDGENSRVAYSAPVSTLLPPFIVIGKPLRAAYFLGKK